MNNCICCHGHLLKHISHHRVYWFCPSCYQEMPNVDKLLLDKHLNRPLAKLQSQSLAVSVK